MASRQYAHLKGSASALIGGQIRHATNNTALQKSSLLSIRYSASPAKPRRFVSSSKSSFIVADWRTLFQPAHNGTPGGAGLHSAHHITEPTMKTLESIPLDGANGVRIEILERSDTTLVIRWVEPGRCHYGEQRWRRRSAHTSGTCAVSRRKIRRGDAVFKPAERPAPSNASAMIAAEVLCNLSES
jgi:hypothetical protein